MMKVQLLTLVFVVFGASAHSLASLSGRTFEDPKLKLFLSLATTDWDFFEPNGDDKALKFIARAPTRDPSKPQGTLTLRIDNTENLTPRRYGEKWLKEFPKYGYEYQMARDSQYGALKGYEIELLSPMTNRRVRQFITSQGDEMWIFTCSAQKDKFTQLVGACEKILKSASLK